MVLLINGDLPVDGSTRGAVGKVKLLLLRDGVGGFGSGNQPVRSSLGMPILSLLLMMLAIVDSVPVTVSLDGGCGFLCYSSSSCVDSRYSFNVNESCRRRVRAMDYGGGSKVGSQA